MELLLAELEELLEGLNYTVSLKTYPLEYSSGKLGEWYVTQALGPEVTINGINPVKAPVLLNNVETCLCYEGSWHNGHQEYGPDSTSLSSKRFKLLLSDLIEALKEKTARAELVAEILIKDGHPFYPVFWDFAYVIVGAGGPIVLIGSSSD